MNLDLFFYVYEFDSHIIKKKFFFSAARNTQNGEGVAIKKVTNVFSKTILTKRALREVKLLQHFRGHKNVSCNNQLIINKKNLRDKYLNNAFFAFPTSYMHALFFNSWQITCLFDMDIVNPHDYNEM